MRTLIIVLCPESVELILLAFQVLSCRSGTLSLSGTGVHESFLLPIADIYSADIKQLLLLILLSDPDVGQVLCFYLLKHPILLPHNAL